MLVHPFPTFLYFLEKYKEPGGDKKTSEIDYIFEVFLYYLPRTLQIINPEDLPILW